jgi:hypothetical protein
MTTYDADGILRTWIATRDPGPAPAALRASVERATEQLRPAPPTRRPWQSTLAAAAAVIIAVGGIALLAYLDAGRTKVLSQPSPVASPSISPDPALPELGKLDPGRYVVSIRGMAVHLTVPDGWFGNGMGLTRAYGSRGLSTLDLLVSSPEVSYVVADVCAKGSDVVLAPIGPGVDALATALAGQKGILMSGPTDVSVAGYPAKKLTLSLSTSCDRSTEHALWADQGRAYGLSLKRGQIVDVYLVDVNGDRLVLAHRYGVDASPSVVEQLDAVTASIAIDPRSGAAPARTPEPGGWLPGGPHSISVDGVPISFGVPGLAPDSGWALDRYEITKDTIGSQDAEAMVYWTRYPGGRHAGRCANLDLPVGGSLVDLAEAISRTRGTSLIAGPDDATIGGLNAKHIVVEVAHDEGCDPKYFFTSDPPGGGPGWWETNVGATVSVWLVDVDSTRLFIAGEWKPTASPELVQEVQDIVASIRFE